MTLCVVVLSGMPVLSSGLASAGAAAGAGAGAHSERTAAAVPVAARWVWPLEREEVSRAFERPADEYSAGHRGIDLPTSVGEDVVAPAAGVVLFAGMVVDRGVLSIRHADGTVSSFEPISASVAAGDEVRSGQPVGRVAEGGHCGAACLHVGARVQGDYVDPEPYFLPRRRAVLVPLGDFAWPG
ncbi:murein hydrolase activator EnvC family protein [Okibacterium fritillariae]|uniref:Peptidase family M23 n=1 Tax=Okibacterium fritillariae TaxID=123320 RepID=A0A1T5J7D8_9MICO|nr:M23 family metallopeptidase [Okibacterium fritillariae]SKC47236.1 Peptidase family M23 [Okibacterium fritillariae]